jgi:hypothetical protein
MNTSNNTNKPATKLTEADAFYRASCYQLNILLSDAITIEKAAHKKIEGQRDTFRSASHRRHAMRAVRREMIRALLATK